MFLMHQFTPIIILDKWVYLLLLVLLADILSGYARAFITSTFNSSIGLKGLVKHSIIVATCFISGLAMHALDQEGIRQITYCFYILTYCLSVIENLGAMGMPYPKFLEKKIQSYLNQLKEGDGDGTGDKV